MELITQDLVTNRKLTAGVLDLEISWAEKNFDLKKFSRFKFSDALTLASGGAYELIYKYQRNHQKITPVTLEEGLLLSLSACLGININETLERFAVAKNKLHDLKSVKEIFFSNDKTLFSLLI